MFASMSDIGFIAAAQNSNKKEMSTAKKDTTAIPEENEEPAGFVILTTDQ